MHAPASARWWASGPSPAPGRRPPRGLLRPVCWVLGHRWVYLLADAERSLRWCARCGAVEVR